jgi:hypothetical protein
MNERCRTTECSTRVSTQRAGQRTSELIEAEKFSGRLSASRCPWSPETTTEPSLSRIDAETRGYDVFSGVVDLRFESGATRSPANKRLAGEIEHGGLATPDAPLAA